MTDFRPADAAELKAVVAWAAGEEQPLELVAGGTKRRLGRPLQVEHTLELAALAGIVDYEPSELVLTAGAATPLAEIEAALVASNQMLAFEPPDWSALLGGTKGRQTIGGVLSANLAGPRRIKAGAARDHFLGFAAVSGRGEAFKAGGRVVKNVTGYDLPKLVAGSWGTLGALAEITVKVMPRPEKARTVLVLGLDETGGVAALAAALNSPHEVSAAAYLPAGVAARSAVSYVGGGRSVAAIRVEGPGPSVEYRCAALREMLAPVGPTEELHRHNSATLWREIGDVDLLAAGPDRVVWRVSVAPSAGPSVVAGVARTVEADWFLDWAGGLVWLAVPVGDDAGAAIVRGAVAKAGGGHAMLVAAPDALRAAVPVFEPLAGPLAALSRRVKEGFDPRRILNPGRMYQGI